MENDSYSLLLCDEELLLSSPTSPIPKERICCCASSRSPLLTDATDEDNDHVFQNYLHKEYIYTPSNSYLEHLQLASDLSTARFRAVRWIIMACGRLNLAYGTLFAAVNYLDRFISMNCYTKWEVWMIELLSIACLSIASKVDEVSIPSLHDFQTEDLDHTFQPSTIQRMELAVLKTLDWRLICVTPYSYVDLLIWHLGSPHVALTARTTELLLGALLEKKLVEYSASAIAVSALRCGLEEVVPLKSDAYLSILEGLMPVERKVEMDKCHRLMEELIADPLYCPASPVTVIPMQKTEVLDCCVDIDTCFFCNKDSGQNFSRKRKSEGLGGSLSK